MEEQMTPAQEDAWDFIQQINAAWREGKPERIPELFHDRMSIVSPDGQRYGEGKMASADSYREFCERATVSDYQEFDIQVDVFETTAIVCYGFEIEYAVDGESNREIGRDVFVLEKQDGRWLAVWRQLSSHPK